MGRFSDLAQPPTLRRFADLALTPPTDTTGVFSWHGNDPPPQGAALAATFDRAMGHRPPAPLQEPIPGSQFFGPDAFSHDSLTEQRRFARNEEALAVLNQARATQPGLKRDLVVAGVSAADLFGLNSYLSRKGLHPVEALMGKEGEFAAIQQAIQQFVAEENEKQAVNRSRGAAIVGRVGKIATEFALTPAAKAATVVGKALATGGRFALHSLIQAPGEGETLTGRAKDVALSAGTGLVLGPLQKIVPNAALRIPAVTAGFMALTTLQGGTAEEIIESGVTILGFEAMGLMQKAGRATKNVVRRQFASKAVKTAKKHNPKLNDMPNAQVEDLLRRQAANNERLGVENFLAKEALWKNAKAAAKAKQQGNPEAWDALMRKHVFGGKAPATPQAAPAEAAPAEAIAALTGANTPTIPQQAQIGPPSEAAEATIVPQGDPAVAPPPALDAAIAQKAAAPETPYQIRQGRLKDGTPIWLVPNRTHPREDGFGDTVHRSEADAREQAEDNIRRDAQDATRKAQAEGIKTAEAATKAEAEDTDGYADQFSPLKRARIVKTLLKQQGINGVVDSRRNHLRRLIAEGRRVVTVKGERILRSADGSFLTERDVTKTGMDYAEYLQEQQGTVAAPETVESLVQKSQGQKGIVKRQTLERANALRIANQRGALEQGEPTPQTELGMVGGERAVETDIDSINERLDREMAAKAAVRKSVIGHPLDPAPVVKGLKDRLIALLKGTQKATGVNKRDIIQRIRKGFKGLKVARGRFAGKAKGIFKEHERVVRTKKWGDIPTLIHEVGHDLSNTFGWNRTGLTAPEAMELRALGETFQGKADAQEGIAEFVRLWATNPEAAQTAAPKFFEKFTAMLNENPEIAGTMNDVRDLVKDFVTQDAFAAVGAQVVSAVPKDPKPLGETLRDAYDTVYKAFVDPNQGLKRLRAAALKRGWTPTTISKDPYMLSRAFLRQSSYVQSWLEGEGQRDKDWNIIGPSWRAILSPIEKDTASLTILSQYGVAKHTLTGRNPAGKPTGITDAQATTVVEAIEAERPDLVEIHKQLVEWRRNLAQYLEDLGGLEPGTVAMWSEIYPDYTPLMRVIDAADGVRNTGGVQPYKRAKGGEQPIIDPLLSDIKMAFAVVRAAELQRIYNTTVEMAQDTPGLGFMIEKVARDVKPIAFRIDEIAKQLRANEIDIPDEVIDEMLRVFRPQAYTPPGTIMIRQAGKWQLYEVKDKFLLENLQVLTQPQQEAYQKWLKYSLPFRVPAKTLKFGVTSTPGFALANKIRDMMNAVVAADFTLLPIFDDVRALATMSANNEAYQAFLATPSAFSGLRAGLMGSEFKQGVTIAHVLGGTWKDLALKPAKVVLDAINFAEKSGRFNIFKPVFKQGGKEGLSRIDQILTASAHAAETNVDFSQRAEVAKWFDSLTAFFNVGLQGTRRLVKNAVGLPNVRFYGPGNKGNVWVRKLIRFYGKAGFTIAGLSLALYMQNRDDPEYWEIPQRDRDLNWWVRVSDKYWVRIPKPFEVGIMFGASTERFARYLDTDDTEGLKRLAESFGQVALPGVIPTFALPLMENWANRSWFWNSPIVPAYSLDNEPWNQVRPSTTEVAREIGRHLNYSPAKIENLVRGYGGTLGVDGLRALDWAMVHFSDTEKVKAGPPQPDKWPLLRRFLRPNLAYAQSIQDFYDEYGKASQAFHTVKDLYAAGRDEEAAALADRRKRELDKHPVYQKYGRAMSELFAARRDIENDKTLSPEQRVKRLVEINRAAANLARVALGRKPLPKNQK